MANNNFFNTFLKKDKFYNITQNNPIYKKAIHQTKYIDEMIIRLTQHDGSAIGAAGYNQYVQYYPNRVPPVAPILTRLPQLYRDILFRNLINRGERIESPEHMRIETRERYGRIPPPGGFLPLPVNYNDIETNQRAIVGADQFRFRRLNYWVPDDAETNYWFPDYQGKFTNLVSKIRQQPIPPPYNKDAKFVPQKYLSDKQKEGLVWLDMNWNVR